QALAEGEGAATEGPVRVWEARVLVPFGLIPEKAAKGCWGEALRLVLAPSQVASTIPKAACKQRDKVSDPDSEEEEEAEEE
ncbi:unnamed protein product, partial [Ectocarpus sp. 12 AP-2014]